MQGKFRFGLRMSVHKSCLFLVDFGPITPAQFLKQLYKIEDLAE